MLTRRALAQFLAAGPAVAVLGPEAFAKPGGLAAEPANDVAASLHSTLARAGDLVASPFSLRAVFQMAAAGAAGETAREMRRALALPPASASEPLSLGEAGRPGELPRFLVANALWPASGIQLRQAWLALMRRWLRQEVVSIDFGRPEAAARIINDWAAANTERLIRDLVTPEQLDGARLVLANAIYFKAHWQHPFMPTSTREEPFHAGPARQIPVQMMNARQRLRYAQGSGFHAVDLPYLGTDMRMAVLLPTERGGLAALESRLGGGRLSGWLADLAVAEPSRVILSLPKFEIASRHDLRTPLEAMGVRRAFRDDADFSGMSAEPLKIGFVTQSAVIRVDEEGTEAAAATALDAAGTGRAPRDQVVFRADHPFLFVLRDAATGAVAFMGRVTEPRAPAAHPS